MKFRMLFVAAALLALCSMSFGQAVSHLFYELDEVLAVHCGTGDCIAEGTMVEIHQDINNNGAGDDDPLADVGGGAGQFNYNTFAMSQVGCGQFFPEAAFTSVGAVPANPRFWLRIQSPSSIWRSTVMTLGVGPSEGDVTWNPCENVVPSCVPSNLNGEFTGPGQVCLGFCPNDLDARWLVHCDPRSAGPIVNVTPGCEDCGNPGCTPAGTVFTVTPGPGPGDWFVNVHANGEGCACLRFAGCEPFCVPDPFLGLVGDRDHVCPTWPGASGCVHVCPGSTTLVTVCGLGGPLNPLNTPLATVTGCATLGAWTYNAATGCFEAVLVGSCDGTACVCVEGFLAANVTSFTAVALSNSVRVDFTTASETAVDRFEITRAIKGHDAVAVARIEATNSSSEHSYSWTDNNAVNGTNYVYNLVVVNTDGSSEIAATMEATPSLTNAVITEYALAQNFPNPFNPSTQIVFDVVAENYTTLKVFNANGQEVATLFNGIADAGRHIVNFDASNLTSGLYFYSVKIGNEFTATKKMMLVK